MNDAGVQHDTSVIISTSCVCFTDKYINNNDNADNKNRKNNNTNNSSNWPMTTYDLTSILILPHCDVNIFSSYTSAFNFQHYFEEIHLMDTAQEPNSFD